MYAHSGTNDGHSKLWQQPCKQLGGKNCHQYVNQQDIITSKLPSRVK